MISYYRQLSADVKIKKIYMLYFYLKTWNKSFSSKAFSASVCQYVNLSVCVNVIGYIWFYLLLFKIILCEDNPYLKASSMQLTWYKNINIYFLWYKVFEIQYNLSILLFSFLLTFLWPLNISSITHSCVLYIYYFWCFATYGYCHPCYI